MHKQNDSAGNLFTLELIAQSLKGSAGAALLNILKAKSADDGSPGRPALGLRLLDLAPVLIEAPVGEVYGSSAGSCVAFGGRGKALVFELPGPVHGHSNKEPLPLWLMVLSRQPDPEAPSVLMASACVDFRGDMHAAATAGGASSPCPFKRCSFRMTPVKDAACALTLECYVRMYAGSQRPVTGGELLLEPSAILPGAHLPPQPPCCTAETQTESPVSPAPAEASATQIAQETLQREEQRQLSEASNGYPAASTNTGAFFPAEISVGAARGDTTTSSAAATGTAQRTAEVTSLPGASPATPAVASSLPLVSKLVRELLQIRSIS